MDKRRDMFKIADIASRAERLNLCAKDRLMLMMDLGNVNDKVGLRLDDFLNADDYNFAHDIIGIQNNMNRETGELENLFLPRFASKEVD